MHVGALGLLDVALGFVAWALVLALGVRLSTVLNRPTARQWWDPATGTAPAAGWAAVSS